MRSKSTDSAARLLKQALDSQQRGELAQAETLYRRILERFPRHFEAWYRLGMLTAQAGRWEASVTAFEAALQADARSAEAHLGLGNALAESGRLAAALASFERAVALRPRLAQAHYGLGNMLDRLGRHDEALARFDAALSLAPDRPELLNNRGNALHALGRHDEALASFDRALALAPGAALLHNNRGDTLRALNRLDEALASFDRALALDSDYAEALNNRGTVLREMQRFEEALASYERALAISPRHPLVHTNRGCVLEDLGRLEEAIAGYEQALALEPGLARTRGMLAAAKLQCCDWRDRDAEAARLVDDVRAGTADIEPFVFLGLTDSPADHLACARLRARNRYPASPAPLWTGERYRHDRIRIAYVSADFREHVMAHCLVELFERHDRARFEITGVSLGPDAPGGLRARLQQAFEHFVEVRAHGDLEVARLLREREIDIAVDLNGYTAGHRTRIFAHRAAPVQVSYLGYPGTMGADYIDYILADRVVLPEEHAAFYTEKAVRLPDTYQVNDSSRVIETPPLDRAASGLPEAGFVFCSFNNPYKISPAIFERWMRILRRVEGSVLWLFDANPAAVRHLRREADARGVAPERLVFAPKVPYETYLARHRLADLALDTLPYNGHATTSDALWAGLPVLTCLGAAFPGRVAASLLQAIGLSELVTHALDEYEAKAVELASHPARLDGVRTRLAANRDTHPLFDTDRVRRHIEAAYVLMWERGQERQPPAPLAVPALARDAAPSRH